MQCCVCGCLWLCPSGSVCLCGHLTTLSSAILRMSFSPRAFIFFFYFVIFFSNYFVCFFIYFSIYLYLIDLFVHVHTDIESCTRAAACDPNFESKSWCDGCEEHRSKCVTLSPHCCTRSQRQEVSTARCIALHYGAVRYVTVQWYYCTVPYFKSLDSVVRYIKVHWIVLHDSIEKKRNADFSIIIFYWAFFFVDT